MPLSLAICEERDVKGLYKLARDGKIKDFTGISSPYEEPYDPELALETGVLSLEKSVARVIDLLRNQEIIPHATEIGSESAGVSVLGKKHIMPLS